MSGLQLCFYCFLIIKGKPTGGISPARLGLLVSRVFQIVVRDGGGMESEILLGRDFLSSGENLRSDFHDSNLFQS